MKILAEDSFVTENLVEIQIVDFDAPFTSEEFKKLQDMQAMVMNNREEEAVF